jgi:hypothetical protein
MQAKADTVGVLPPAVGLVLVLLFGAALAACRDNCPPGQTKCGGNELWTCPNTPDGPHHWAKWDCGARICVTIDVPNSPGWVESFCAMETEPRPACAGVVKVCDSSEMLFCRDGFVIGAQTCGSADLCALGVRNMSLCPLALTPDPRCDSAESTWWGTRVCDGTVSVECHSDNELDYAASEFDCGAAGCAHGVCGTSGPADPRCEAAAAERPEWPNQMTCDGNVALVCNGDHLLYQSTCGVLTCFPGGPPDDLDVRGYCG